MDGASRMELTTVCHTQSLAGADLARPFFVQKKFTISIWCMLDNKLYMVYNVHSGKEATANI